MPLRVLGSHGRRSIPARVQVTPFSGSTWVTLPRHCRLLVIANALANLPRERGEPADVSTAEVATANWAFAVQATST